MPGGRHARRRNRRIGCPPFCLGRRCEDHIEGWAPWSGSGTLTGAWQLAGAHRGRGRAQPATPCWPPSSRHSRHPGPASQGVAILIGSDQEKTWARSVLAHRESRSRSPTHSPPPSDCVGDPHSLSAAYATASYYGGPPGPGLGRETLNWGPATSRQRTQAITVRWPTPPPRIGAPPR
jgi:hypothetical protein